MTYWLFWAAKRDPVSNNIKRSKELCCMNPISLQFCAREVNFCHGEWWPTGFEEEVPADWYRVRQYDGWVILQSWKRQTRQFRWHHYSVVQVLHEGTERLISMWWYGTAVSDLAIPVCPCISGWHYSQTSYSSCF